MKATNIIFVAVIIFGLLSALTIPKTLSFYFGTKAELQKTEIDREVIHEQVMYLEERSRERSLEVLKQQDKNSHTIELRGETMEPEEDRVFDRNEIFFDVL